MGNLKMMFLVLGFALVVPVAGHTLIPELISTSLPSNSSITNHLVNADSISPKNLIQNLTDVTVSEKTTWSYESNVKSSNVSLTSTFSSAVDEETSSELDSSTAFLTDDLLPEAGGSLNDPTYDLENVTSEEFNLSSPSLYDLSNNTSVDLSPSIPSSLATAIDDGRTAGQTTSNELVTKLTTVLSPIIQVTLAEQQYARGVAKDTSTQPYPVSGSTMSTPKTTPTTLAFITSTRWPSLPLKKPSPSSYLPVKHSNPSSYLPVKHSNPSSSFTPRNSSPSSTLPPKKPSSSSSLPSVNGNQSSTSSLESTVPSPQEPSKTSKTVKNVLSTLSRPVVNEEMLGSDPPASHSDELGYNPNEEERDFFLPPTQSNSVYFDFRRLCPEEHAGDVWWNRTYGGVIAVRFCPEGYTGKVYRMCYYGGNWGEVDFSECRVQQLIKLKHLLYYHVHKNLTEGFHSLADELLSSLLRFRLRSIDDYLESLDSLNIIINARVPLDFDVGSDFKYLKTILKISDILFSRFDNKWSFPQDQKEMVTMKMVQILHGMTHFGNLVAEGVKRSSRSVVVFTDFSHIGLEAKVIKGDQDYRVAPPGTGSSVHLPGRIYKVLGSNDKYVVVTTWYNRIAQSLHEDEGMVNSAIFATTVHPGHDLHMEAGPVTATLQLHEKIDGNYYAECGYLRRTYNKSSLWSNVGCSVTEQQATSVTCICHHMANIAVLVRHQHNVGHVQWKPISLIVMIGCCISLAALLCTFVAHVHLLRYDSSESSLILLNLLLAMTAAQLVFMGGIQATSSREVCEGVSIVLHYLYLVSSFWLLSHGIHVYLTTKSSKEMSSNSHMRDYCLLSWAAPVGFVFVTFAVNPHGYEIRKYCWLSIERGMLLSYIVPIFCLITINTTLMVLVLKHLFETQSAMKKVEIDKARTSVRAGVILLPYFGVNWFLGVLAMEDRSTEIFQTIFAISTAVQGLLILLFYGVLQTEVRKAFRQFTSKVLRRRKSADLKLRRSRRRGSKFDSEPLLIGHEICDCVASPSSTNLAAQCLPSPEEPFVLAEERET